MQIQLRKSRFGGVPGRRRKAQHPTGREEKLLTAQMWWGKDDFGEWEKGLAGQEDTKRGSERKYTEVS
jgi:hypothetical protein